MNVRHSVIVNPRIRTLREAAQLDAKDMARIRDAVDVRFREAEKRLFATQGASGSDGRWPALSPAYAKWKRRRYPGRKIMQRTGQLRKSLTTKGAEHVATYSVRPATVSVGTSDRVAAYHIASAGNPLRNKRLPHRDTLSLSKANEEAMFKAAGDYLQSKLDRIHRALAAAGNAMRLRITQRGG